MLGMETERPPRPAETATDVLLTLDQLGHLDRLSRLVIGPEGTVIELDKAPGTLRRAALPATPAERIESALSVYSPPEAPDESTI